MGFKVRGKKWKNQKKICRFGHAISFYMYYLYLKNVHFLCLVNCSCNEWFSLKSNIFLFSRKKNKHTVDFFRNFDIFADNSAISFSFHWQECLKIYKNQKVLWETRLFFFWIARKRSFPLQNYSIFYSRRMAKLWTRVLRQYLVDARKNLIYHYFSGTYFFVLFDLVKTIFNSCR